MSRHEEIAAKIFRELLPETARLLVGEPEGRRTRHLYAPRTVVRGNGRAWNNKTDGHGVRWKLPAKKKRA